MVAGSYSQTYLRNAFNNGFVCIACPALVHRVRDVLAAEVASGARTVICDDEVAVDFAAGAITWRGEQFGFPPLGLVPQELVVAGGIENKVRQELGLA